jgi:hypothetical protein
MVNPIIGEQRIDKLRFHVSELSARLEEAINIFKASSDKQIWIAQTEQIIQRAKADLYGKARKSKTLSEVSK